MANIIPRSDRAAIEALVLAITRGLLREIGDASAIEGMGASANLERDLGLESIERQELASRLDRRLGISLPESAIAEAQTLDDIVSAIAEAPGSEAGKAIEQAAAGSPRDAENTPSAAEPDLGQVSSFNVAAQDLAGVSGGLERSGLFWRVLETIYGIYAAALFFIWLVLTWLVVLTMPAGRAAARLTSAALHTYFIAIGCRIHLEGREHIRAHGASIYVSNHTSYSDVPVVMALFDPNYHFVAKSEISHMPFIGTFLRKLGHFSFDRNKLRARSHQAEQMEKALLRGESVFVFAEGTFTARPGVRPFQLGAFRAAVKTGRPVIPVALRGTRRFLRDGTFLPKPSRISVTVCPALFPNTEETGREWAEVLRLRDETRRMISSHSGEPLLHTSNAYEQPHSGKPR